MADPVLMRLGDMFRCQKRYISSVFHAAHRWRTPPRRDALLHNRGMTRFLILFIVILVLLFAAELTEPVQNAFVIPWTEGLARISAGIVTVFDSQVTAHGKILQSTASGFAVSIEAGCNGIEAAIILIAAMLAFPAPLKNKLAGIIIGLFAVQALNIVRVISLFYIGQWSMKAFEWMHLYLWQALIMLDVLIVWLLWIRLLPNNAPQVPVDPTPIPPREGTAAAD